MGWCKQVESLSVFRMPRASLKRRQSKVEVRVPSKAFDGGLASLIQTLLAASVRGNRIGFVMQAGEAAELGMSQRHAASVVF